jgi:hypothetical protein
MIGRFMKRAEKFGAVKKEKRGNESYWLLEDPSAFDRGRWWKCGWNLDPDDKRLKPRLGRIPVEIDQELLCLAASFGRPFSTEEIIAAWGRLREQRKAGTVAGNMTAIIKADRRRAERNARRAALAGRADA